MAELAAEAGAIVTDNTSDSAPFDLGEIDPVHEPDFTVPDADTQSASTDAHENPFPSESEKEADEREMAEQYGVPAAEGFAQFAIATLDSLSQLILKQYGVKPADARLSAAEKKPLIHWGTQALLEAGFGKDKEVPAWAMLLFAVGATYSGRIAGAVMIAQANKAAIAGTKATKEKPVSTAKRGRRSRAEIAAELSEREGVQVLYDQNKKTYYRSDNYANVIR